MSYSGKAVHRASATGGQEAFFEGHVHAFTRLGGIPAGKVRYNLPPRPNPSPAPARGRPVTAEFGHSNAGKVWLRRVEPLTNARPDPALIPARGIARQSATAVIVDGHTVRVTLADRNKQHDLELTVPLWDQRDAATVARLLDDVRLTPLDDLPDGLLANLRAHQIDLAPQVDEIQVRPPTAPRRHVLAALYKLIQRLDEEPRQALLLRLPATRNERTTLAAQSPWIPLAQLGSATFYTLRAVGPDLAADVDIVNHATSTPRTRQPSRTNAVTNHDHPQGGGQPNDETRSAVF